MPDQPPVNDSRRDKPALPAGAVPDDYAKYGQHADCVFEFDTLREHFREQFPPCPNCGCRTSDDADSRDCGCDAGCNDGEYPPGVNVLIDQATAAERERIRPLIVQWREAGTSLASSNPAWSSHFYDSASELERLLDGTP